MIRKILCFIGRHEWRRSKFVALNSRVANWVCVHCDKQIDGEDSPRRVKLW